MPYLIRASQFTKDFLKVSLDPCPNPVGMNILTLTDETQGCMICPKPQKWKWARTNPFPVLQTISVLPSLT